MTSSEFANIAAIILAAGRSTRMGAENKLTADLSGKPMVRCAAQAALGSRARPVVAVVGHEAEAVRAALAGLDVGIVHNPDFATGLASSLRAGIRAVPADCGGALVLLGDMPQITAEHLDRLIAAFVADAIIVPTQAGKRGNPVLWPAVYFAEMRQLVGDAGARSLMAAHTDQVRDVDLGTDAIFADVDTPDALARLRRDG